MPLTRRRPTATLLAVLCTTGVLAGAAPANTGSPNIHTPHPLGADSEFADPATQEFGGRFDVYIGNSEENSGVVACISSRCRPLTQNGDNRYSATGSYFNLTLKRGQERTVEVWAANGDADDTWGPAKVTVR